LQRLIQTYGVDDRDKPDHDGGWRLERNPEGSVVELLI
jgi:hypothetical protein